MCCAGVRRVCVWRYGSDREGARHGSVNTVAETATASLPIAYRCELVLSVPALLVWDCLFAGVGDAWTGRQHTLPPRCVQVPLWPAAQTGFVGMAFSGG